MPSFRLWHHSRLLARHRAFCSPYGLLSPMTWANVVSLWLPDAHSEHPQALLFRPHHHALVSNLIFGMRYKWIWLPATLQRRPSDAANWRATPTNNVRRFAPMVSQHVFQSGALILEALCAAIVASWLGPVFPGGVGATTSWWSLTHQHDLVAPRSVRCRSGWHPLTCLRIPISFFDCCNFLFLRILYYFCFRLRFVSLLLGSLVIT